KMPFDRSSSFGAGSFGISKFKRIGSFSHSRFVYGNIEARKSYVRVNAFAFPLKSTCASSLSRSLYTATHVSRIGSSLSRSAPDRNNCTSFRLDHVNKLPRYRALLLGHEVYSGPSLRSEL